MEIFDNECFKEYRPCFVGGSNTITDIELDKEDGQVLFKWEINNIGSGRYFHKDLVLRAIFEYVNKHGKVLNPTL